MKVIFYRYFPGPNVHALRPVSEALVDLEERSEDRTDRIPDLPDRLVACLPGLSQHHCSRSHPGGFVERLHEGTYLGHVVEHVALELLTVAGERVVYGKTRARGPAPDTVMRVVFESETRHSGRRAVESSVELLLALLAERDQWVERQVRVWRDELAQYRWGPSTRAIVDAARQRGIPVARLDDDSLVRLGEGYAQVRIRASLTDRASAIAVDRAQDKAETKRVLANAGIPVPAGRIAVDVSDAVSLLGSLGGPVVVKPVDASQGQGITMHITAPDEMPAAFAEAKARSDQVLVEQEVAGVNYRLLVVGSRVVAAARRDPPTVVGNGRDSLATLVAQLNQDPRRGVGHAFPLSWVPMDARLDRYLQGRDLTRDWVPEDGQVVALSTAANLSTGASATDVTDDVDPDLAREAVRAAQALGLDVAGVDIVAPRVDLSLAQTGGAVVEVNAAPGLRMHELPASGTGRRVGEAIVSHLFPDGATGRIPVACVTGTNGKTTVTRMLARILHTAGLNTGMATTDGIFIGDSRVARGDLTGPWSARLLLDDPAVEAAVLETARGGIARGGLGFDACDVAIVTNIGVDHLGQDGIRDLDDLVHLKSLTVEVARSDGAVVLNAEDERVLGMAERTRARVWLFSATPDHPAVQSHRAQGGSAVFVRGGFLVWGAGAVDRRLIAIKSVPASLNGIAVVNVANAAAAAAGALAMGVDPRTVRTALHQFPAGGQGVNRGRLEVLPGQDITVLIDYGHNAPAVAALGSICRRLMGRRLNHVTAVLGLPGDRRNEDLIRTAEAVASFADRVVVREDADLRGRRPGEVAKLLAYAVKAWGVPATAVDVVLDEAEAVRHAVATALAGTLVLVLYERYDVVCTAAREALDARAGAQAELALVGQELS